MIHRKETVEDTDLEGKGRKRRCAGKNEGNVRKIRKLAIVKREKIMQRKENVECGYLDRK